MNIRRCSTIVSAAALIVAVLVHAANAKNPVPPIVDPSALSNMVCVQESGSTGGVVRLACKVAGDVSGVVSPQTPAARSNDQILRDLYKERHELPFWKNY